jgi:hypothetical protein
LCRLVTRTPSIQRESLACELRIHCGILGIGVRSTLRSLPTLLRCVKLRVVLLAYSIPDVGGLHYYLVLTNDHWLSGWFKLTSVLS